MVQYPLGSGHPVRGVCDVAGKDAVECFADDLLDCLAKDTEVKLSKTENMLDTVTDAATLTRTRKNSWWLRKVGVTTLLPVVEEVKLE